jgi:hypothetical protein
VVVPTSFEEKSGSEEASELHFVLTLMAITLADDVLRARFISKCSTDDPNASRASYFQYVARYSSEKAFVTASIFGDYLHTICLPFVPIVRSEL